MPRSVGESRPAARVAIDARNSRKDKVRNMRVRSKLADVEFLVGSIERRENDLIINSRPDQPLKSRIYISPRDVLALLGKLIASPAAWVFMLGLPYFYVRSRKRPGG